MVKLLIGFAVVLFLTSLQACGSLNVGGGGGTDASLSEADDFSSACLTANDCAGSSICVSGRVCTVSAFSGNCDCLGDPDGQCANLGLSTCTLSGGSCATIASCCQGLSCNNGTCEGPSGRCPFTLLQ
ncbi:MAG: hypothetical protein A2W61_08040 [Deltaproteobacteria bacterium RIFCSPLOWO2_01_44_7]|nr:MAG: hypothetical protein A2712_10420 [Deltaproteobacteria bacterium RIFCSPHIGHO2_01_FULL_43_49]OGQ15521.1 MAG: hypothetical protein A3D22_10950 [Deltaproteobacteria bacterium RIFCSPHIGHO2_02_FULL_44_53]OGQ28463.1 MAG: hypothetical protein A3D98_03135 [Deltaproteobacteria bacterium RIFCSPHIGHO2_12_FULL_44_21]OGQ32327.1 MAG: hypothetical protein A2979_00795 [Deltaproteobacteria bacterium RIFCSPLOWO2_01_FULL_45_74]OGQ37689.1 MAG: hypothetical protein A2W61_08040 [Deltaproteobacteria bacterium 